MASLNKIIAKAPSKPFQIRKTTKSSIEQEKALRDQLHIEIENKTKACSNPTYSCSIPRLDGYEFCIRHILQDSRAPYKQCAYVYPTNGKKCTQAAPKHDNKKEAASAFTNYCFEHSRLVQLNKTHEIIGQYKQVETNEAYLNDLTHHIKIDKQSSPVHQADTDEEIDVVSSNVEPFINYVHVAKFDAKNENKARRRRILDYASDSSTDDDVPTVNNTWKGHEWDHSDNESVDSQNEDFLKHAGIYTTEEATMIAKQKMKHLQTLYMEQIQRLQHLLKEKRRKYLQAIRKERETLCSIHDQPKDTPEERRLYEKLKALNHYHKRHGVEAVLQKKFHEKRLKANEGVPAHKGPLYTKCIFTEGGVKCGERALPCCKFCKKHILEDKKQILFRACGVEKSGIVCQEPVPNIFEDSTCVLHINFPTQTTYTQKKFESETEEDDDDMSKKTKMETNNDDGESMVINNKNNITINNLNKVEVKIEPTSNEIINIVTTINEDQLNHDYSNNNNNNDKIDNNLKKEIENNDEEGDAEIVSVDDIGNNVTIAHDLQETSSSQDSSTAAAALNKNNKEEDVDQKNESEKNNDANNSNEEIILEIMTE